MSRMSPINASNCCAGIGRHLDRRTVGDALIGLFQRQFEHADHGVHRRADFMAHGRQKRGFGPIGIVRGVLGFLQLLQQLLTLTDLPTLPDDPAQRQQRKRPAPANAWRIACRCRSQ